MKPFYIRKSAYIDNLGIRLEIWRLEENEDDELLFSWMFDPSTEVPYLLTVAESFIAGLAFGLGNEYNLSDITENTLPFEYDDGNDNIKEDDKVH